MFLVTSYIKIGNVEFDFVNQVEVASSWQNQTTTAKIILPANVKVNKDALKNAIPKGAPVTIQIGYDGRLNTIFTGFVSRLHAKVPIEIECEDYMWKLKQLQVNDTCKNEKLQGFLARNIPYQIECFDITVPKYIASKVTAAQLLDKIKQDFGFPVFVRNGTIMVGKQYDPDHNTVHTVVLEGNGNSNVAANDLEFTSKDDVKIKVRAISNMDNGKKEEIELGDPDGQERTLNFFNIPKSDLKAITEKEMERLNYDGYRGSITLYGEPFVSHGDILEITNPQENDKTGRYWIDGVTYTLSIGGGIRQEATLGPKA